MHDVIVIGGGLTGLIAFRHLAAELDVLLLEARPRVLASASRWDSGFWVFLGVWRTQKKIQMIPNPSRGSFFFNDV